MKPSECKGKHEERKNNRCTTFSYAKEECIGTEEIKNRYIYLLERLDFHPEALSVQDREVHLRGNYCDNPGASNAQMLAIGMDVSTESRDSFGINVVVTRFMGDPALFERKANELLGHDPLYGALEESSVTQEVLSQIQKHPCPRCHEEMKCVKKRFGVIGADYFNMKKHLINFCVGRTQEEKEIVDALMKAKGQKKSPTHRPIEITLREIKSVKKLKALCLDCEKVTKVLKGILKEFSKK